MAARELDVAAGKVVLSSGVIWTVFATYATQEDAEFAAQILRERTLPRSRNILT